MARREDYRRELESIDEQEWEPYLLDWSGLPGPRGNLGLAQAVADLAPPQRLRGWAAIAAREVPTGSREEFLAFCGTLGLGRLATEGDTGALGLLRRAANDQRWRVREAAAMALQRIGLGDFDGLAAMLAGWVSGTPLERRAVVAALCEPALLTDAARAKRVLDALDAITAGFTQRSSRTGAAPTSGPCARRWATAGASRSRRFRPSMACRCRSTPRHRDKLGSPARARADPPQQGGRAVRRWPLPTPPRPTVDGFLVAHPAAAPWPAGARPASRSRPHPRAGGRGRPPHSGIGAATSRRLTALSTRSERPPRPCRVRPDGRWLSTAAPRTAIS